MPAFRWMIKTRLSSSPPLWMAPKLALYWAMKERGVNNSDWHGNSKSRETVIRRMLDPDHSTKPEKIQAAMEALGKRFLIAIEDAA